MEGIKSLRDWSPTGEVLNIFGPCSAESPEQMMNTAQDLLTTGIPFIFRAGLWKPRTRPGSFEGHGEKALPWLLEVKKETGLKVTTEVATPEHVELCLEGGVDVLWVGARTVANPFSVQAIAEALKGNDIPVLVKNPIHADLSLWIGALERIHGVGITALGAIHRGFHHFDNRPYRNRPDWHIPIELKRRFPALPVICDVSHISGSPEIIPRVAQRAMDLNMDGLLIESHQKPKDALSDAKQQITPEHLLEIFRSLRKGTELISDEHFMRELETLRKQIDDIDVSMLDLIAERMHIVKEIGVLKREKGMTIFQLKRWRDVMENFMSKGSEKGLNPVFIKKVLEVIHLESIGIQEEVFKDQHLSRE